MNTDPIADFLTRIRNGQRACNEGVSVPASRIKIAIAHILKQEGFIKNYRCIRDSKQGVLKVTLKYRDQGASERREDSKRQENGARQENSERQGAHEQAGARQQHRVGKAYTSGVIREIKRLSRPGRRYYVDSKSIPLVKNGFGIVVLSTSQGVMTDREARRRGTGGELLCSVY